MNKCLLVEIKYRDNLIIVASNVTQLKWLKSDLEKEFKMNDLGKLHYCLGMEFEMNRAAYTIIITQRSYIEKILKQFNIEKYKSVRTPSDVNSKLLKTSNEEFENM